MVQALHFTSYNLSHGSWDDWLKPHYEGTRLSSELDETFGPARDIFVDSGGFQLLYADKIDLSKWNLEVSPADILSLQLKYRPQRIVNLDTPIGPNAHGYTLRSLRKRNIATAVWLAENLASFDSKPIPYFVMHGRTRDEVEHFARRFEAALPPGWLRRHDYGLALGSQVPLTSQPDIVSDNIKALLRWMKTACRPDAPLHVFGVGEGLVGQIPEEELSQRTISFDNSTWVQKAFRMKMFDETAMSYRAFDPLRLPNCECAACAQLANWGEEFLHELMSKPAYHPSVSNGKSVNRSDVLAMVGLHNLQSWQERLPIAPTRLAQSQPVIPKTQTSDHVSFSYEFPLRKFTPDSDHLLVIPCSKGRPYQKSRSHRRVLEALQEQGFGEGEHFDRITLSGLYGPVHWKHEDHPAILGYDFPLSGLVSDTHARWLRLQTATVLGVIRKKYEGLVAYLPSKRYFKVFEPVTTAFDATVAKNVDDVAASMKRLVGGQGP